MIFRKKKSSIEKFTFNFFLLGKKAWKVSIEISKSRICSSLNLSWKKKKMKNEIRTLKTKQFDSTDRDRPISEFQSISFNLIRLKCFFVDKQKIVREKNWWKINDQTSR